MPVIVWVIIAIVGVGAGTAVVVPAVVGDDKKDEVKTAPADPKPTKTVVVVTPPIEETAPVEDDAELDHDEPLPEKLPYADEPLIPLDGNGAGGMTKKLPF